jgi:LDH2 family malate/lactate/ureidoglycolate dehydrogenase
MNQRMGEERPRISRSLLEDFCTSVFERSGLGTEDARVSAEVLVAADAAGVPSHGLARLGRYVEGLATGLMDPRARAETVTETATSLVIDAHGAMGAPTSRRAMAAVIAKARDSGAAFACVRQSNHFGIAGYYARMALREDMLGIAMTNTAALGVPTFGSAALFGTNPIAFAAPAAQERAFVLDMSTTVVSRGKIEVQARAGSAIPEGWAVDREGRDTTFPEPLLADMQERAGGGILPLGGRGTAFGGHKGYGLAVMVDILCSVLCGASFGAALRDTDGSSARVSHFFGAIRIASFRDPVEFRKDMDEMLRALRESPAAEGEERVLHAGLPESEFEAECSQAGVPVARTTLEAMAAIGSRVGVPIPFGGTYYRVG